MIITLASETIARRKTPTKIEYKMFKNSNKVMWFVDYANGDGKWLDNFEDVEKFIREKKLASPKVIENLHHTKERLLKDSYSRLKKINRENEIRNSCIYQTVKELAELKKQLLSDGVAKTELEASRLLELHYLKEIHEDIYQLVMDGQEPLPG